MSVRTSSNNEEPFPKRGCPRSSPRRRRRSARGARRRLRGEDHLRARGENPREADRVLGRDDYRFVIIVTHLVASFSRNKSVVSVGAGTRSGGSARGRGRAAFAARRGRSHHRRPSPDHRRPKSESTRASRVWSEARTSTPRTTTERPRCDARSTKDEPRFAR